MSDMLARGTPAINSDTTPPSTATTPRSPSPGSRHSPGLQIPEPTDGYFGYSEEKSLRHVRTSVVSGDIMIDRPGGGVDCALSIQAVLAELEMTCLPGHNVHVDRGKGVVTSATICPSIRGSPLRSLQFAISSPAPKHAVTAPLASFQTPPSH